MYFSRFRFRKLNAITSSSFHRYYSKTILQDTSTNSFTDFFSNYFSRSAKDTGVIPRKFTNFNSRGFFFLRNPTTIPHGLSLKIFLVIFPVTFICIRSSQFFTLINNNNTSYSGSYSNQILQQAIESYNTKTEGKPPPRNLSRFLQEIPPDF